MPQITHKNTSKELSPAALELIATRFSALAEPMRLRILNLLMKEECTIGRLVEMTASSQANISKHVALLRDAGMVGSRKEGPCNYCFIADPIVNELCEMMCSRLRDEMEAKAEDLQSFAPSGHSST
jgi:DNA-binding transcriptional ArsR family regulator